MGAGLGELGHQLGKVRAAQKCTSVIKQGEVPIRRARIKLEAM